MPSTSGNETGNPAWALEFRDVGRVVQTDDGSRTVLQGISGRIAPGRVVTLVGPSGAGKSTLLALCNLFATPDEGQVFVSGREVREWPLPQLRRHVGLVMQQPVMLPGTVADNLAVPYQLQGRPAPNGKELLEQVGLPADLLSRAASELSGGQQQRVALARTLANQPQVLLLDEVTSALDRGSAAVIEQNIREWVAKRQLTVLWVTHDLAQAERVGDETWLLVDGRLVEQAPTRAFFQAPTTEEGRRFLEFGAAGQKADPSSGEVSGQTADQAAREVADQTAADAHGASGLVPESRVVSEADEGDEP
ncbi:ABC transporter ATP-binding protein [Alicyclobacillus herbarius]|uniref:ABC transporter ATP-binding protein n=1 Tax=Alicyclobacillus herbarius TaxID=122960 RepID=UPI0003FA403E|nr:phosphate ABC transporter ATP-binding protein [Alicyclobacillus herbarius]